MSMIMPVTPPEVGLIYKSENVKLKVGQKILGNGTLYLSQSYLSWQPNDMPDGLSVQWRNIPVHGICGGERKSIYFMIDIELMWDKLENGVNGHVNNGNDAVAAANDIEDAAESNSEDEGHATDEEYPMCTECWLIPDDINSIDVIDRAMTDCQALNPDKSDSSISEASLFMDDGSSDEEEEDDIPMHVSNEPYMGSNDEDDGANAAQGGIHNLNLNGDNSPQLPN